MDEVFPVKTPAQRVQRLAGIVRSVPIKWTDSTRYEEADLSLILGFIEARYRVNTPSRVFIVQTMAPQISFEMLERAGVKDMTSCFLIAVRSLLGDDFPEITTDEDASEILRLNDQFTDASETIGIQVEAIYVDGKCERTGREFRFGDWIEESNSDGRRPDADRTQKKNSAKNSRPWDTNCKRMAKAYIRQCVKDGSEIARGSFIKDELRKNLTNYPDAKSAATIDKAFQLNPDQWKPALSEALSKPDADRTH